MATSKSDSDSLPQVIRDQIKATIYGQCIGDAIGLLTEFMDKTEAKEHYGNKPTDLKYEQKISDFHRCNWENGDWTDDTDQMILILQSLLYNKGEVVPVDFAKRMLFWSRRGFIEFGDWGGCGLGETTSKVLGDFEFLQDPHKAAERVWVRSGHKSAPNGGVMRTSILGLHHWTNLEAVKNNALAICKTTHRDPRCQASVVAVSTCIALMLQHTQRMLDNRKTKKMKVDNLIQQSYDAACEVLDTAEQKKELWKFMSCSDLAKLDLDEEDSIGYTYKSMGSGFWALKQDNFKKAMIKLVMEGGDADTNGCVAGALMACRLGMATVPTHWASGLIHREMIDTLCERFITLQSQMTLPVEDRADGSDMSLQNLREKGEAIKAEADRKLQEDNLRKKEEGEKGT